MPQSELTKILLRYIQEGKQEHAKNKQEATMLAEQARQRMTVTWHDEAIKWCHHELPLLARTAAALGETRVEICVLREGQDLNSQHGLRVKICQDAGLQVIKEQIDAHFDYDNAHMERPVDAFYVVWS